jgi:hypothetical protein|tara:strand:- start:662 stop:1777 length:1116 start_codon:yes stop_codon:yes gene_type:complete
MKKHLLLIGITALSNSIFAQTPVPRLPLYELFTSSTCPPCAPANDNLTPIFQDPINEGEFAVVKYQMSWPGTGDPYYTNEGSARKNVYSVNSVPALFVDAASNSGSGYTQADMDANNNGLAYMTIEAIHSIETDSQKVHIQVEITAHQDYLDPIHRVYIMINESRTVGNVKTNGETEFFDVMKKVLPTSTGDFIMGTISADTVLSYNIDYKFQGNYRLPADADDAVNHNSEHSVEDFNNLKVIVFVQSMATGREIYQATNSIEVDPVIADGTFPNHLFTSTKSHKNFSAQQFSVSPNPSSEYLNLDFEVLKQEPIRVNITNSLGQRVEVVDIDSHLGPNQIRIDVSDYDRGIYFLEMSFDNKIYNQKIIVQ